MGGRIKGAWGVGFPKTRRTLNLNPNQTDIPFHGQASKASFHQTWRTAGKDAVQLAWLAS